MKSQSRISGFFPVDFAFSFHGICFYDIKPCRTPQTYNFAEQCPPPLGEVSVPSRVYVLMFCFVLCSLPGAAQNQLPHPPAPTQHDVNPPMMDGDEARDRITHDMEKKAAKERVAALKSDTDKLLKLSVELKAYVDKSDENVLSLDVIKKAEEIEKLARSVRDKMKGPT